MPNRKDHHEEFVSKEEIKGSSDRAFGITFGIVLTLIALWPLVNGHPPYVYILVVAATFFLIAAAKPGLLRLLNRGWFTVGIWLNTITSPFVMGVLFFFAVVPTALIMRAFKMDTLRLSFDPKAKSYWVERTPPGPPPESLHHQF